MSQIADSVTGDLATSRDAGALEKRLLRTMIVIGAAAVVVAPFVAPWRVTTGLLLGGSLSILNYRWLHSSAAAIINLNIGSPAPSARSLRYVLRYLIVAAVVFAAYQLRLVSLPATLAGLSSFVPALMCEAFRQFYFIIIHREESI
jgi:hypothetical protein